MEILCLTISRGRFINGPVGDIHVIAFPSWLTITTVGYDIKVTVAPRAEVDVVVAPRVFGNFSLGKIAAGTPLIGKSAGGWGLNQGLQTLFCGGVGAVVEFVDFNGCFQTGDLDGSHGAFGLFRVAHDLWAHISSQNANDDEDDKQFNEGESVL